MSYRKGMDFHYLIKKICKWHYKQCKRWHPFYCKWDVIHFDPHKKGHCPPKPAFDCGNVCINVYLRCKDHKKRPHC